MRKNEIAPQLATTISIVALCMALYNLVTELQREPVQSTSKKPESTLQRIQREGVISVGYGGFPPYTIVELNPEQGHRPVNGFAVDMITEIAARHDPPLRVEWHNLNWESIRLDMASGRIDVLADAVYHTVARASQFGMSTPFSYFGIGAAIVRKDDKRFTKFSDLDQDGITIAVAQGWTSTEYAQAQLIKPTWKIIPVGESAFTQLDYVASGRADVALQDVPTILQYARSHSEIVDALWVEKPPAIVPAGFTTRIEDVFLLRFLDTSIHILRTDGTIDKLDKKWRGLGHYQDFTLLPGIGLFNNE